MEVLTVAINDETQDIVGVDPYMFTKIKFNDEVIIAAQPCDTAVDPNFQRRGLFMKLNEFSLDYALKNNIQLFYGFANANSYPGYVKLGWKTVSVFDESFLFDDFAKVVRNKTSKSVYHIGSKILSPIFNKLEYCIKRIDKIISQDDYYIQKEDRFTNEFNDIWNSDTTSKIKLEKEANYMNWRFLERPDKDYEIWTLRRNGELLSYIVSSISNRWGSIEGQIVDFEYKDEKAYFCLLKEVIKDMKITNKCAFISILSFTDENIMKKLKKLGFYNRSSIQLKKFVPQRSFIANSLNDRMTKEFYDINNWSLRQFDQDTY